MKKGCVIILCACCAAACAAAEIPAMFRYPDAAERSERVSISDARVTAESAFATARAANDVHTYYRCLMDTLGWTCVADGAPQSPAGAPPLPRRSHYTHGDMRLSVITSAREPGLPLRVAVRFSVPVPGDGTLEAPHDLHPYARRTGGVTHLAEGRRQEMTTWQCSDPPAVFFRHTEARLREQGWRTHNELELYKPFGLQQERLRWFRRGDRHLLAVADPAAPGSWTYTLMTGESIRKGSFHE